MRLFLSSYRFGAHYDRFAALVGEPGPVAVIPNAFDAWPEAWQSAVTSDLVPLRRLGFRPDVLDLRDYVGRTAELEKSLRRYRLVWARGGNTFVLRAQFARSGADLVLPALLAEDALVYAGYSAGACVLTPDLHGLEAADDPAEVASACGIEPRWDGVGLVGHRIVPHVDSPATDPDGSCTRIAAEYRAAGVPHWALTDDDAVIIDGDRVDTLLSRPA
ncbi:Type 1 glutamine amidotransferase-like domain-containing protein [Nocardia transvalensis]|uniref:Type 1 glutamine amidotransferase-like domain-containing protein n=1 Tax=Nocardia transvalensis TaxID=37333 RepID=UPI0018938D4C|nr:Type 1 glutamine amidotransferase-like domain-containing protein [Nocardia transvalensis]MBF6334056.1 Type 1 glutamine amidotransferase-like domain-containing protein [Nocardia transvalensis]